MREKSSRSDSVWERWNNLIDAEVQGQWQSFVETERDSSSLSLYQFNFRYAQQEKFLFKPVVGGATPSLPTNGEVRQTVERREPKGEKKTYLVFYGPLVYLANTPVFQAEKVGAAPTRTTNFDTYWYQWVLFDTNRNVVWYLLIYEKKMANFKWQIE